MFIPIGDAPSPKGTPLVTWALIAANLAVFLLFNHKRHVGRMHTPPGWS